MNRRSGLSAWIAIAAHCHQTLYQIRWAFGNRNWIPPHLVWGDLHFLKRATSQQTTVGHGLEWLMSYRRSNPIRQGPAIHMTRRRKAGSAELLRVQAQRVLLRRVLPCGQCPADRLRREFISKTGLVSDFPLRHTLSLSRVHCSRLTS